MLAWGRLPRWSPTGPTFIANKLNFEEVRSRIENLYHPYHGALRQLIEETRHQYGACLLVDCHSMPSIGEPMDNGQDNSRTDIILGDRFGSSCAPWITDLAQSILEKEGFIVKRNRPYAGGFTTHHYGTPDDHVHALQIELNRALYMDEENVTRLPELEDIKKRIETLINQLCAIDPQRL